jgi:hypothetical protein
MKLINNLIPAEFSVSQNHPEPFGGTTIIKYCLPYETRVKITVYNADGDAIKILVDEEKKPGTYAAQFNAAFLPDGIYFYRIEADGYFETKKMTLVK